MTKALRFLAALLLALPLFTQAQGTISRTYTQAELDQMLAPVALYPDALLSQVLMAATYPDEVREAADWSRANPGLQGDEAVRAVQTANWDPSVQSLVAFPQILARMDENRAWTRSLGDAFLMQERHVMDTVQQLRRRAQAAGNLQSSEQMYVQQDGQAISIQPASPQYVYVPYYDPLVVYGPWWWPRYRPVVWAPWPGYVRPYHRPGISVGFWWGQPVGLSLNFFFGNFDWHHRHVRVAHPTVYYYRPAFAVNRAVVVTPHRWQHDTVHRRGVDYRHAEVRQRFANTPVERRAERQAAPSATVTPMPAQPRAQQREERRDDGRAERQRAQERQRQAQQQARQQQRAPMPAAQAPQTPRAERQERREERRDHRKVHDKG